MKRFKKLKNESRALSVFEVESALLQVLEDKFGITSSIHKFDNRFDIYISNYNIPQERVDAIPEALKKEVAKMELEGVENINVVDTKFGYSIILGPDSQKVKLMEQKENEFECIICESTTKGSGHDVWPIYNDPAARACTECDNEYVKPARLEALRNRVDESIEPTQVKRDASNTVLDDKYIWLFSVLDTEGEDIKEGIEMLDEAIDELVNEKGTFLVAFPYVDPNPDDSDVDIIFADNPGPVIIYNREQASKHKRDIKRPTEEEKPKTEATITEGLVSQSTQKLVNAIAADINTITDETALELRNFGAVDVELFDFYDKLKTLVVKHIKEELESYENIEDIVIEEDAEYGNNKLHVYDSTKEDVRYDDDDDLKTEATTEDSDKQEEASGYGKGNYEYYKIKVASVHMPEIYATAYNRTVYGDNDVLIDSLTEEVKNRLEANMFDPFDERPYEDPYAIEIEIDNVTEEEYYANVEDPTEVREESFEDESYGIEESENEGALTKDQLDDVELSPSIIADQIMSSMDSIVRDAYSENLWTPEYEEEDFDEETYEQPGLIWGAHEEVKEEITRLLEEHLEEMDCEQLAVSILDTVDRIVRQSYSENLWTPEYEEEDFDEETYEKPGLIYGVYEEVKEEVISIIEVSK